MKIHFCTRLHLNFTGLILLLTFFVDPFLFAQAPDSIFFRDDFDRASPGNSWDVSGWWSIRNGSAYNFSSGPGETLKTTRYFSQSSYIIETRARGFTSNYHREFRITFGQSDLANHNKLYQLSYTGWFGGRLTLSCATDNVFFPETLDEIAIFPQFNAFTWYRFKIARYQSGLIQVYLDKGQGYDSIPVLEAIDSSYVELGHLGWQVDTMTYPEDFYVDWISAGKPGIEKPASKEKPVEDSLIRQVSAKSGKPYKVDKLVPGVKQLIDRDYVITSVPDYLKGASFIQAANDDKQNASDDFLSCFINAYPSSAIAYIGYDSRATEIPAWLSTWDKTTDTIGTSDEKAGSLILYTKSINGFNQTYPFPFLLGGNLASPAGGAATNYLVAIIKKPPAITLQAEDALLSGAVIASNHPNYNGSGFVDFKNPTDDYIEWTLQTQVPGTYGLGFRYANGSNKSRALQVTIDGFITDTVYFSPGFFRSWSSWPSVYPPEYVFFSPGLHTVRITAIGTSGPNIDELSVNFNSPAVSEAPAPVGIVSRREYLSNNINAGKLPDLSCKPYPNPFSGRTRISYQVPAKARVNLSIYTLQGQQIQVLENRWRNAGSYQVTFNGDKLGKGIYFYRLQIGGRIIGGKLIKE